MPPPVSLRRRRGRWWYFLASFALLAAVRWTWDGLHPTPIDPSMDAIAPGHYAVRRIREDGLLELHLSSGESTRQRWVELRLLGIKIVDGPAAAAGMTELIGPQRVWLRFDRRRLDNDGHLLGYVFVGGQLVNAELVRRGLARDDTHPSDFGPLVRQIKQAVSEARLLGKAGP